MRIFLKHERKSLGSLPRSEGKAKLLEKIGQISEVEGRIGKLFVSLTRRIACLAPPAHFLLFWEISIEEKKP